FLLQKVCVIGFKVRQLPIQSAQFRIFRDLVQPRVIVLPLCSEESATSSASSRGERLALSWLTEKISPLSSLGTSMKSRMSSSVTLQVGCRSVRSSAAAGGFRAGVLHWPCPRKCLRSRASPDRGTRRTVPRTDGRYWHCALR